ncbi:MAG: carbamoyl phosphate synthase small subunit [Candidatus Cloacimonetes bacterium]|nr:carbamoyl phosphate synthase small subunit [Candidatus Cloacimonadota bacterium]
MQDRWLILSDGTKFKGHAIGSDNFKSGELAFHTGMSGYMESITDPSYKGQSLCFTYPSIGNYGVDLKYDNLQSKTPSISALIICDSSDYYGDNSEALSLDQYLKNQNIAGISGIDTRALVKLQSNDPPLIARLSDSSSFNINKSQRFESPVSGVHRFSKSRSGKDLPWILVIDCGCKQGIIDLVLLCDVNVITIDHRLNYHEIKDRLESYQAIVISNGPGNPKSYSVLIDMLKISLNQQIPIFGVCLGHQVLALAAGAETELLEHAHRSHNQPIIDLKTNRCYNSSQNHSYAVSKDSISKDWKVWFENLNDGSIEGLSHKNNIFKSVQFHPEGCSGPQDLAGVITDFINEATRL